MAKRGMMAVLVGQADEEYQSRFMRGLLTQTSKANMDVCVFSMYRKYQSSPEREAGEANIFQLINYKKFQAVVILKDTIQTTGVAERVEDEVHDNFDGPVIVIEQPSPYFPSVCTDGYTPVVELVSHLIEDHGYRDIAFLTGKKWHPHSKQRLEAYKEAMRKHDLEIREDRIIYGDFWYKSGNLCVEQLLASEDGLPEAIACANDQMAIGVCEELTNRGYRVPEDVAVIGYDSTREGASSPIPLTSAVVAAELCGIYAADYLIAKIKHRSFGEFTGRAEIITGPSCGCTGDQCTIHPGPALRKKWGTELSEDGFFSVFNPMADDLLKQTSLTGYLSSIYTYAYQLRGATEFHLCLNESWCGMDREDSPHCKSDGYEKKILHAIRYNGDGSDGLVSTNDFFDVEKMLPDLGKAKIPSVYYFTPIFFDEECYGYAVVSYGNQPRTYDEVYLKWINVVCRGFEALRRITALRVAESKSAEARKFSTVRISDALTPEEKLDYDTVEQILDENLLTYHFQPIVRVSNGEIYSYEALMRSKTERRISPIGIIKYAGMMGRMMDIERATFRNVLQIVEEREDIFSEKKVFINSIPGVRLDDRTSGEIDDLLTKHCDNVVVEMTEEAELTEDDLDEMKKYYRSKKIEIAIDDYGTGYSNIANLLRYTPDYVKIDRSLLSDIQNKPQKQYFVREIIDFCHNNDIMALAEGVETTEELRMVIHLGVDLIQGYYTAKPAAEIITRIGKNIRNEIKTFYRERQEGTEQRSYKAGRAVRVPLNSLTKDGYTEIVVGEGNPTCRDVTFTGTPGMTTDLHLRIAPNYTGVLTLENVYFSSVKGSPCIDLGENSDVTLVFRGENVLRRGGIRVPESARLVVEGNGDLRIRLDMEEYYGIGNDLLSRNGEIAFEQDGEIYIESTGKEGVCVGSGHGGNIHVRRGKFFMEVNSDKCVGIGAMYEDVDLKISECAIVTDFSLFGGVCIGSMEGSVRANITKSSVKCVIGGNAVVAIGTVEGARSEVHVESAGVALNTRGDQSTSVGALQGNTEVSLHYTGFRVDGRGKGARVFGGGMGETKLSVGNSDALIRIRTNVPVDEVTREKEVKLDDARFQFTINDRDVDIR